MSTPASWLMGLGCPILQRLDSSKLHFLDSLELGFQIWFRFCQLDAVWNFRGRSEQTASLISDGKQSHGDFSLSFSFLCAGYYLREGREARQGYRHPFLTVWIKQMLCGSRASSSGSDKSVPVRQLGWCVYGAAIPGLLSDSPSPWSWGRGSHPGSPSAV